MNTLDNAIRWILETRPRRIVAFTGAGVSAESGVPTFRGATGLWKEYRAEDLATPEAFRRDPRLVWEWYEWRRSKIREAEPNAAHHALAAAEIALESRGRFDLVTQNVDGLHVRAGSRRVHELHGNIFRVRCAANRHRFDMLEPPGEIPPVCDCGSLLRPDVVWFGEALPSETFSQAAEASSGADLFLVIGTSGAVYPAAGLAQLAPRGTIVDINPDETPFGRVARFALRDTAAAAVPPIVQAVVEALS